MTTRLPGPELAGHGDRGDEVRARRRARPDALLARGAAGHRERLLLRHGADLVDVAGEVELRRHEAGAAALDAVRPRGPAGEDGGLGRLDRDPVDAREPGAQRSADAEEAAGGADIGDPGVRAPVELREDLLAHGVVAGGHVVIVELVGEEAADVLGDRECALAHRRDELRRDPSGLGSTSSAAPNARIVASFSSANASELTIRVG